jgi:hypothetical protein
MKETIATISQISKLTGIASFFPKNNGILGLALSDWGCAQSTGRRSLAGSFVFQGELAVITTSKWLPLMLVGLSM